MICDWIFWPFDWSEALAKVYAATDSAFSFLKVHPLNFSIFGNLIKLKIPPNHQVLVPFLLNSFSRHSSNSLSTRFRYCVRWYMFSLPHFLTSSKASPAELLVPIFLLFLSCISETFQPLPTVHFKSYCHTFMYLLHQNPTLIAITSVSFPSLL